MDRLESALARLNPEQRRAAEHGDDPLLIVAGAGTGKTTTLAHRVAHLIASGTPPGRILLLTFSRRAAAEMLRRVDGILREVGVGDGRPASSQVWGGTFHAVAQRLLRAHGEAIGLEPAFTIHDRGDSEDLLNLVRTELGLARTDRRFPKKTTCMDLYSRSINARKRLEDLVDASFPWCRSHVEDLKRLFRAYVDRKTEQAVLDYDDLLLFWLGLLEDPVAGQAVRARFDRVLVDEYQDTNALQADILRHLRPGGVGLTVVGDDAQSIYSFRAATVRNILEFPEVFPGRGGATVLPLEQSYRSTRPILEATNAVIAQARERWQKTLWTTRGAGTPPQLVCCQDEPEQTELVIARILEHREAGVDLRRQAVLFRAGHHSMALELELGRRGIPFHKYGGLRFLETAHVKDLLGFLRLAENPRDRVAGTRVLMLLEGIGPRRAQALLGALGPGTGLEPWRGQDVPSPSWPAFLALMLDLGRRDPGSLGAQIHRVRQFYAPLAEDRYDDAAARLRDLEQLEQVSARFPDRRTFLAELALDPPSSTQDLAGPPMLDDDYLVLSTIHSAKGLEWDAVYVIHASDGNIPSDLATGRLDEIEEELRLFYVALTRARDHLYVTFPLRYYARPGGFGDGHSYAQLTRFLDGEARARFAESVARPAPAEDAPAAAASVTSEAIRRQIRALWS